MVENDNTKFSDIIPKSTEKGKNNAKFRGWTEEGHSFFYDMAKMITEDRNTPRGRGFEASFREAKKDQEALVRRRVALGGQDAMSQEGPCKLQLFKTILTYNGLEEENIVNLGIQEHEETNPTNEEAQHDNDEDSSVSSNYDNRAQV